MSTIVWTLADALPLLREVQTLVEPLGYHVGLVGSVLTKGFSYSDLDMAESIWIVLHLESPHA